MSETSLLVKIDGSQAASSASNLDSVLGRLEAAGVQVAGAFDRLTAETQKSAAAMAAAMQSASAYERGVQRAGASQQAASQQSANFIRQLEMQIATFGKTREEVLRLEAAQLRLTTTSYEPLISQLEQLRKAEEQAADAALRQAMIQGAIQQSIAAVDTERYQMIEALREEIAMFGMSETQQVQYRAQLLGISDAVGPLIAQLTALRAAQSAQTSGEAAAATAIARERDETAQLSVTLAAADTARYGLIEGLREQVATFGMSATELAAYQARLLGVSNAVDPLIADLNRLNTAQRLANQAVADASARTTFISNLREQSETYGMTTSQVLAYRAAQLGVTGESEEFIARIRSQEAAQQRANDQMRVGTLTAGEYRQAMRMLPMQITDIVTSLAGGMPIYMVAIQQGGQLRDSFGGIVPAARALLGAISPLTVLFASLGATAAALFYGFKAGQDEVEDLNRHLILTGRYAGTSATELESVARAISNIAGSRSNAAEVLGELVSTGQVGASSLQRFGEVTVAASRSLELSTQQIASDFADLAREPLQASLRLDGALHYLNASTLRQIQSLDEQGRKTDAARVAQNAFADALSQRSAEMEGKLSPLSQLWQGIADAIGRAKDNLLDIGRAGSTEGIWETLSGFLTLPSLPGPAGAFAVGAGRAQGAAAAGEQAKADDALAKQLAINEAGKQGAQVYQQFYRDSLTGAQRYSQQLQILDDAIQKMTAAGIAPEGGQVAQIRAMLADSLLPSTLDSRVSAVQQAMQSEVQAIQDADRLVEAQHSARLVSDSAYYDTLIANVQRSSDAQVAALNAEIALLQREPAFGEKAIQNRQRIAESTAEIARIQSSATTQTRVLQIQSQEAAETIRRNFERARESAQNYLDTLGRTYQRQLDDYGAGPAARRYSQGRNAIDDQYMQQEQQLQLDRIAHPERSAQYDDQLKLIREYHDRAIEQWDDYYRRIEEKQADFSAGFRESMLSWVDANRNVGESLGANLTSAFDRAIQGASDFAAANLLWGEGGSEAAKALARELLTGVVSGFIQAGIQAAVFYALQQTGIIAVKATETTAEVASTATSVAAITTQTAASVAAAAIVAAAWAPAAAAVSLASFGSNALAAAAGIATTYGLTQGLAMTAMLPAYGSGGLVPGGEQIIRINERGEEFVVNAQATAKNRLMLEAMNRGIDPPAWAGTPMAAQQTVVSTAVAPKVQIFNNGQAMQVSQQSWDGETLRMVVEQAASVAEQRTAAGIASGRGSSYRAIQSTFSTPGKPKRSGA